MKLKIFVSILIVGFVVFAVYSASKTDEFQPAEDFPRGALAYVQIADFPALLKLWNESGFKEKYFKSENFGDFRSNHLGLKLASRRAEFSAASGFPIDLDTLGGLADNRAAFALYDIGKLDFVFVAPIRDEVFAATMFAVHKDDFQEQTLEGGTIVYRATVEADRGRQNQELIFAQVKGRFVLATSERLLAQTLNNIDGGGTAKSRLTDEPTFASLSEKIEPRSATVWVNQTALGEDYYFKRYWLMSDAENLKNIRAGIFDFSLEDGKIVERRKFLLKEKTDSAPIDAARAAETLAFVPADVPFYRLQKADAKSANAAIENTLFDRSRAENESEKENNLYPSAFDDFGGDSRYRDYSYLSENFDETIDETEESDEKTIERPEAEIDFSRFLGAANPQAVLTFTEPKVLQPAPLFVRFGRAAIFNLSAPAAFRRAEFEAATAEKFLGQATVRSSGVRLNWETKIENDFERRALRLPMSNFAANYAVRGNLLVVTDDAELLRKIIENPSPQTIESRAAAFGELAVVNLDQIENAYTKIFAELARRDAADEFFVGNVASLLASVADIKKIEIKRNGSGEFLDETITAFR